MPTDDLIPRSPEWWIARLWAKLDERTRRIQLYDDYYEGNHRLRFMTDQSREVFGTFFQGIAVNFCELVVDATEERLGIRGFRVAEATDVDPDAASIWETNDMDVQSSMVHTEALCNEEGYLIVWVDPRDRTRPVITAESPFEVIVERSSVTRLQREAALKRWLDDDRHWRVELYLPDAIHKYVSHDPVRKGQGMGTALRRPGYWDPFQVEGEEWPLPNPLGVVPVVPITNRPRLGYAFGGTSELKAAVPIQDIINKIVYDEMVASEFVAYPQRWMVGVDIPTDPLTGKPVERFRAGVNRIWAFQLDSNGTAPSVGQFDPADMDPYVGRVDAKIGQLAAITKTPKHYLIDTGGGTNLSGETVKALEAPLVAKVRRRQGVFGVGWAEVMAIALRLKEGGRYQPSDADRIEVDWKDPETRTEAQHIDALVKLGSDPIGIPQEQLWRDAGYSEEQVARFREAKSPTADRVLELVKEGVMDHDEARADLGLPARVYAEGTTPEEMSSLIEQVKEGLRTHEEVRTQLGLPPIQWPDEPDPGDVTTMLELVKTGVMNPDEARARLKLPPLAYAEGPSPDDIASLVTQIKEGLLTIDEARASLGREPVQWPEDLSEKVSQAVELVKGGFDPADTLAKLGLPPIKHLGLPPVTVQKEADAAGMTPAPAPADGVPLPQVNVP